MKFTNYVYSVAFVNDKGDQRLLNYRIVDNPISKIWLNNLITALSQPYELNLIKSSNHLKDQLASLLVKLEQTINEINSGEFIKSVNIIKPQNLLTDKHNLKNNLNFLHSEFQRIRELDNYFELIINHNYLPVHILNDLIHNIEKAIDSSNVTYFGIMPIQNNNHMIRTTFEQDIIPHFDHIQQNGDLLLGYEIVGKNLIQCFADDDTEAIKNNLLRPQKVIGTQTILWFDTTLHTSTITNQRLQVDKWLQENNLNLDSDPYNKIISQPILGRLIDSISIYGILDIYDNYQISHISLVESESLNELG